MRNLNLVGGRARRLLLLVCLLPVLNAGKTVATDQNTQKPSESTTAKPKKSHPYCGLYCLYTTMKMADKEIDFRELVKPEYIGSRKGSTLAELKKAAEDNGLYAKSVTKLNSRTLRVSPHPIILHVKSTADQKEYNHFELFLGIRNGQAKLFNPPEPVRLVPFRKLAPRWDGNGLIVSASPIDLGAIFAPARKRFIMYTTITVVVILMVHWARRRWLPLRDMPSRRLLELSAAQGAVFAITALLCGMIYHFANDEGFLAHANATAAIREAHTSNFIPKISEKKARKLLDTDTVFVDARFPRDFKTGHLEGAINVPVDANDIEYQAATIAIAKDARIVVYCQSAGCKFAEKVAIKLMSDDFSNVSIFRGGWRKWVAKSDK